MERREMLTALAASAFAGSSGEGAATANTFLELKTWRLHNTAENQLARVSDYLQHGLIPATERAGSKVIGAFSNYIGADGPYYVTLTQYASLSAMQDTLAKLISDKAEAEKL